MLNGEVMFREELLVFVFFSSLLLSYENLIVLLEFRVDFLIMEMVIIRLL